MEINALINTVIIIIIMIMMIIIIIIIITPADMKYRVLITILRSKDMTYPGLTPDSKLLWQDHIALSGKQHWGS